jgi:hypothetical protein
VESSALLHDIDKLPAVRPTVADLAHGAGSAEWLARRGHPELGEAIVGHPVTCLADGRWFDLWFAGASNEALIVAYADKRAGQKVESMAERFASWERRYPPEVRAERARGNWTPETLAAVRKRAEALEARVCEFVGVAPADVRRLEWTGRALRLARDA